mgnify:CR=1 FL=1
MDGLKYHRILLKLSGEALASPQGFGIDPQRALHIAERLAKCVNWAWMLPSSLGPATSGAAASDWKLAWTAPLQTTWACLPP